MFKHFRCYTILTRLASLAATRYARPARLGGFASTIDKTPEASPTNKVGVNATERSSNIGLQINMMNIEPDVELVDSDDSDDENGSQVRGLEERSDEKENAILEVVISFATSFSVKVDAAFIATQS